MFWANKKNQKVWLSRWPSHQHTHTESTQFQTDRQTDRYESSIFPHPHNPQFVKDCDTSNDSSATKAFPVFWKNFKKMFQYEPAHYKTNKMACAPSKDSDQPGHLPSDQSLGCALNGQLRTQVCFMRRVKTLIRLHGCLGWSESSLGAHATLSCYPAC